MTDTARPAPLDILVLLAVAWLAVSPTLMACGLVPEVNVWAFFPAPHLFALFCLTLMRALILKIVPRWVLSFGLPAARLIPAMGILVAFGLFFHAAAGAGCQTGSLYGTSGPFAVFGSLAAYLLSPLGMILIYVFVVLVSGLHLGPKQRAAP